jgi:hypothetical protein
MIRGCIRIVTGIAAIIAALVTVWTAPAAAQAKGVDPEMIDYVIRVEDPLTWKKPWTMRMTITRQPNYEIDEYSCHEGNVALKHTLLGEREYEKAAAEAATRGLPPPERVNGADRGR